MNNMNNHIGSVDRASCSSSKVNGGGGDQEEVALPGFRFHPTDEELVGFYLRRKVEKKPLKIELIKHVDIYKYDPWDLPKPSGVGEKEGYFFCRRGRKYRNSIRPNRVTGSGFWKATGIDKPVYNGECRLCIGLKKTLVYYRGSAGKGTKTDWMMHEFRLPAEESTTSVVSKPSTQEAEVWTLCRIFKRNVSHRKYTSDWRELSNRRQSNQTEKTYATTCSTVDNSNVRENYLSFVAPTIQFSHEEKPVVARADQERTTKLLNLQQLSSVAYQQHQPPPSTVSSAQNVSNLAGSYGNDLFGYGDWDELRSVVELAFDHDSFSHM